MRMYRIYGKFIYIPKEEGGYNIFVEDDSGKKLCIFDEYDEFEKWLNLNNYQIQNDCIVKEID